MKLTNLKLKRLQLGLKQEEVAKSLGISRSYLAQLENQHASIDGSLMIKLAQYYKCETIDLV